MATLEDTMVAPTRPFDCPSCGRVGTVSAVPVDVEHDLETCSACGWTSADA